MVTKAAPSGAAFFGPSESLRRGSAPQRSQQLVNFGPIVHFVDDEHASGAVDVVQLFAVHDKAVFDDRDVVVCGAFGTWIDRRCRNLRDIAADIAHALYDADGAARIGYHEKGRLLS